MSGVPAQPLAIDTIEIRGEVSGPAAAPRLERGELLLAAGLGPTAGAGPITAGAHLDRSRGGYTLQVEMQTPRLDRSDLDRLWPADLASDARARVAKTFVAGTLRDVAVSAAIGIEPGNESPATIDLLDASAVLDRLELDVLAPQPSVVLDGHARLDLAAVTATIDRAALRDLELGPAQVALESWRGDQPTLRLETGWRGPLQSVLALLAGEPLALFDAARLADATGATTGDLRLELALGEAAESKPTVVATADVAGLEWPSGLFELPVSDGELRVDYARDELAVAGDARLASSPARVTMRHRFDQIEPRDSVRFEASIDRDTARALGLPEGRFVDGTIVVDGTYSGLRDGTHSVQATADLADASLELAEAGVSKPAGENGHASVDAVLDEAGILTMRSLVVEARELAGSGSFTATTAPFRLESATVERLELGRGELAGTLRRRADGGFSVTARAERIDLRGFLAPETTTGSIQADEAVAPSTDGVANAASSAAREIPFDFEVAAGSLLLLDDVETQRFDARGAWDGERWERLAIHGAFDAATQIAFDYDRDTDRDVSFETSDLGRLWSALASDSEIRGGQLRVGGAPSPSGAGMRGHAELRDFTLIEMPVFASILTLGTLSNLMGMFETRGLEFKKADADLDWDGRVLTISNGRAIGPGIALTGGGTFDLAAGTVDFSGTVAPMRMVQRMVAKVPVINRLVLGRDRAGVIATRFHVTGATAAPQIRVEPLSTFTPGFLRDVFGARPGRERGDEREGDRVDESDRGES
jgi:hypothetical protein